jgi:hypothetical protein
VQCESLRNIFIERAYIHAGKKRRPKKHFTLWRAQDILNAELQRSLKRYTFSIRLASFVQGGWLLNLSCPRRKDDFGWETLYSYRSKPGQIVVQAPKYTVCEGDAVLAALRLAEGRLLNRVRLCELCSDRWLFAKHRNYRFCNAACRETYYTRTPEYRESKKRQMREYRKNQRILEEASKGFSESCSWRWLASARTSWFSCAPCHLDGQSRPGLVIACPDKSREKP